MHVSTFMGGCEYLLIPVESFKVRATLKQSSHLTFRKFETETKLECGISLTVRGVGLWSSGLWHCNPTIQ